ncbi:WD40-repeat-containing domain protein [Blyttiomyces helicus]|uniref:WD40-repeat-containing domain protein n=1 Tax=Blyttiomyces helicus TaxID=388810 RepID=A0A4P9W7R9_9FUNG|nr:WD40-repeat-containing domain protein [Blyttiomyces helicus]|eukprot:RKO87435.1 WD40-repeat-containing domain protein [Blyttiomyces helicus]
MEIPATPSRTKRKADNTGSETPRGFRRDADPRSPFTKKIQSSPQQVPRVLSKTPYKVLDAPELQDDFYLNLVDWSAGNILGVGLGSCVYLWSAATSKVTKLHDVSPYDTVTSVNWSPRGNQIAIGRNDGTTEIWDAQKHQLVRSFSGHTGRVGSLAWFSDHGLTSGSRDRTIILRDMRVPEPIVTSTYHRQEVCGLKWDPRTQTLASGGNDNKLILWDRRKASVRHKFDQHTAAVKAIAWSPHTTNLLASGGGTADRKIRFWNTVTNECLKVQDTGSQVCNLAWAKHSNEIVSTHGYSQNQINVWKYPTMEPVATLTGHSFRVLYLAMSPDGSNIVTGAGDETLRFWDVFPKQKVVTPVNQFRNTPHDIR